MDDSTPRDIGSAVDALLGSQSCSPLVGVRTNRCSTCEGSGVVGDERAHRNCRDCAGTGLARTIVDLVEERAEVRRSMRAAHVAGDIAAREEMRAQVARLDVEIAAMRAQEAA